MPLITRMRKSGFILKLMAGAAWLGLPLGAAAARGYDGNAQPTPPTIDNRSVPAEYDPASALQSTVDGGNNAQDVAQIFSPPPPPPPRPPAVLSVRG